MTTPNLERQYEIFVSIAKKVSAVDGAVVAFDFNKTYNTWKSAVTLFA